MKYIIKNNLQWSETNRYYCCIKKWSTSLVLQSSNFFFVYDLVSQVPIMLKRLHDLKVEGENSDNKRCPPDRPFAMFAKTNRSFTIKNRGKTDTVAQKENKNSANRNSDEKHSINGQISPKDAKLDVVFNSPTKKDGFSCKLLVLSSCCM